MCSTPNEGILKRHRSFGSLEDPTTRSHLHDLGTSSPTSRTRGPAQHDSRAHDLLSPGPAGKLIARGRRARAASLLGHGFSHGLRTPT